MAHYAKIDETNTVTAVIVADQDFIDSGKVGDSVLWVQTSYNTHENQQPEGRPLRGNYAGIGYTYDITNDVFYAEQPFSSWTLNETTWSWAAPVPMPTDEKMYVWDEPTISWLVDDRVTA